MEISFFNDLYNSNSIYKVITLPNNSKYFSISDKVYCKEEYLSFYLYYLEHFETLDFTINRVIFNQLKDNQMVYESYQDLSYNKKIFFEQYLGINFNQLTFEDHTILKEFLEGIVDPNDNTSLLSYDLGILFDHHVKSITENDFMRLYYTTDNFIKYKNKLNSIKFIVQVLTI